MRIVIIVAMRNDRLIGKAGGLPWHVPADLRHFKQTTMGHAVIMGRKTFDSCGKPLPGRRNIVITRSVAPAPPALARVDDRQTSLDWVPSLDAALALCRFRSEEIAFIVGGAQIYAAALPLADEMIITTIEAPDAEGDTYFPRWEPAHWEESPFEADPTLTVRHYRRRRETM